MDVWTVILSCSRGAPNFQESIAVLNDLTAFGKFAVRHHEHYQDIRRKGPIFSSYQEEFR
jgi:hypothetical protein